MVAAAGQAFDVLGPLTGRNVPDAVTHGKLDHDDRGTQLRQSQASAVTGTVEVPPEFRGIWRRSSVRYGTDRPTEPALTLWWQAPHRFIDVRWRFDSSSPEVDGLSLDRVMAGHTTYEEAGFLTWHHDIDSFSGAGADRSAVHWEGEDLIEVGELGPAPDGAPAEFTEVWRRMVSEQPDISDQHTGESRLLSGRVGSWTVEVAVPAGPDEPTTVLLECRGSAHWSLRATFPPSSPGAD